MAKIIVYKGGEGSGNFGHEGRPGKIGGSSTGGGGAQSFQTSKAGTVSVGDNIFYRSQMHRNRGIPGKAGEVLSAPDANGFIKVTVGMNLPGIKPAVEEIHTDDIVNVTIPADKPKVKMPKGYKPFHIANGPVVQAADKRNVAAKRALDTIINHPDIKSFARSLVKAGKISKTTANWMIDVHKARGYTTGTGYGMADDLVAVINGDDANE